MGGKISVDPAKLEQSGRRIEQLAQEYIKLCEQMYSAVDLMAGAWRGADNQAYVARVNVFREEFVKTLEQVVGLSGFLIEAADRYRKTQQALVAAAGRLSASGGGGSAWPGFIDGFRDRMITILPFPMPGQSIGGGIAVGVGAADRIMISLSEVSGAAQQMRTSAGRLDGKLGEIRQVVGSLSGDWESGAATTMIAKLNTSLAKVEQQRGAVDQYANFLDETVARYQATESRISAQAGDV